MLQLRYADYWLSAGMHEQKLRAQHVLRPKAEPERLLMLRDYPYKLLWISYFCSLFSVIKFHSLRWSAQLITRRLCTPSARQIYIINNIKANFHSKSFHFLPIFPFFSHDLSPQFFIFHPSILSPTPTNPPSKVLNQIILSSTSPLFYHHNHIIVTIKILRFQ